MSDDPNSRKHAVTSPARDAPALQVDVAFLLEDVPDEDTDWRYRVRIWHGSASGWVDVHGTGEPLEPEAVQALVLARSRDLPEEARVRILETMSPLAADPPG